MGVDTRAVRALCNDFPSRIAAPKFCKEAKAALREMADELDMVRVALVNLEVEAAQMERECTGEKPCVHAWGIRHAIEHVRDDVSRLDEQ